MDRLWPDTYITKQPKRKVNWGWLELWEQENPRPSSEGWDAWYLLYRAMSDRCWVAACFPQYAVFDWPEEDVQAARKLLSLHTCGVCGRNDDPGCTRGC